MNFNLILISADEIKDEDKIFDSVYEKPVPLKKMVELF